VSSILDRNCTSIFLALLAPILTAVGCGGGAYPGVHHGPPPEGATLNTISVYAYSTPSVAVGGTVYVLAGGYYDVPIGQNAYQDLTNSATWTTSNAGVATVAKGVVTGTGMGSATITATVGTKRGSITVVIGLTPTIDITPAGTGMFSLSSNRTQQFHATATYSDGTVLDLTVFASWSESPEGIVAFNFNDPYGLEPGLATFLATGTTTVTASLNTGEEGTMIVTVVP
jgi:hypothetical protein